MSVDIPYLVTNRRLPELFSKIQTAAVPSRFSFEFLKKLGFASSNDRAFPSLLKRLGFVDPAGAPTDRYRTYRNPREAPMVLAQAIRELYSELFAVDENVPKESREHVRGVISSVTGMEERYVNLATSTFRALCALANFETLPTMPPEPTTPSTALPQTGRDQHGADTAKHKTVTLEFRHNIEIHLPATTNISVYNAIFRSLREQLGE